MLGMIKENCFQKVALSSSLPNVINTIINIAQVSQFKIHALYIGSISSLLQKGQEHIFSNVFPPKFQSKCFRQMNASRFERCKIYVNGLDVCRTVCISCSMGLHHQKASPASPQLGYVSIWLTNSGGLSCCG